MKDAKGHGSDPRAGHKLAADYRATHQLPTNAIPTVRQAFTAELKRFGASTSGSGKQMLHEIPDDSEKYQNVGESYAEALSTAHVAHAAHAAHPHVEPSHLMHLAHFFHSMAALAVADVLMRSLSHLV